MVESILSSFVPKGYLTYLFG